MAVKPKTENNQEETKTDEEWPEGLGEVPATYCDTYYINIWPSYIRITFGEALAPKAYFREAIAMPIKDAEQLANDILSLIRKYKEDAAKEQG